MNHVHSDTELHAIGKCPRQWAARYLFHIPGGPKNEAAQEGIDMGQLLERMLNEGPTANEQPESRIGRLARAVYPLAPPGAEAELHERFTFVTPAPGGGTESHIVDLRCDWFVRPYHAPEEGPRGAMIGDWKRVKKAERALAGPRASAERQQQALANDLQANLYALGFMQLHGLNALPLRWCYVAADTEKAWPCDAVLTRVQCQAWLEVNALPRMRLIEQLRELHATGLIRSLHDLPHEPIACTFRSGIYCDWQGRCQFKPSPTIPSVERLYQLSAKRS